MSFFSENNILPQLTSITRPVIRATGRLFDYVIQNQNIWKRVLFEDVGN